MSKPANRPPYTSLAVLGAILLTAFVLTHAERFRAGDAARPDAGALDLKKLGTLTDLAFADGDGAGVRLSDFRGRPVVLNLWATWCAPCVEEMPSLDRLQRDFPGVAVVAISLDKAGPAKVRAFFKDQDLQHLRVYSDPKMTSMRQLGVLGLPATLLIGADGREVGSLSGAVDWDSGPARRAVAALTHDGGPGGEAGGPEGGDGGEEPLHVRDRAPRPMARPALEASYGRPD
jgi:thiol-disulfide isomerase/thioredoxin